MEINNFNNYLDVEKRKLDAKEQMLSRLETELAEDKRSLESRKSVLGKL